MHKLITEDTISLREAAAMLPRGRNGRPVHQTTINRWVRRGIRGHRLEAVRVGGSIFTSTQALARFISLISEEEEHPR